MIALSWQHTHEPAFSVGKLLILHVKSMHGKNKYGFAACMYFQLFFNVRTKFCGYGLLLYVKSMHGKYRYGVAACMYFQLCNVLTKFCGYGRFPFVSCSTFLIVTHNSKQEKHPFFKRSPYISRGHSNKKVRFSKRSISNTFIKSGNILIALLYKQK